MPADWESTCDVVKMNEFDCAYCNIKDWHIRNIDQRVETGKTWYERKK